MTPAKLKELQDLLYEGNSDKVPKGWHNRQEVAVIFNRSIVQSDKILAGLVKQGLVKRQMFRRPTNAGVRSIPFFYFNEKKTR